ncbi:hypothetical protein EOM86_09240, partial [Candidatus Nomurabacteria bacterium]|nr:hypothetical protein [Candidatus Nomurabacteria bacterium]
MEANMKRSPSFFLSMVIAMTLLICLSPLLYPAAAQVAAEYAEENADEPASPVLPEEEDLPLPSPAPLSFISQSDIDLYESVYIGNKSENVQKAMKRLKDLGYIDNAPSGDIFTYLMTNFVKEFQQVNGILANGLISQETQALLFSDYAIPKEKTESSPEIETEVAQTAELDHSEDPETEYPDFLYTIIDDQAAISGYTGTNNTIDIPEKIEGKPVTSLDMWDIDQPSEILRFSLPLTVTSIPEGFFSQFNKIRSITVAEDNPSFSSFNGVLFDKARETLLVYPAGKTPASYRIPNSVISIGALAFSSAHSLTEIIISDHVNYIGKQAFVDCVKLKEMVIPDSVIYIEEEAFTNCKSMRSIDVSQGNPVYKAVNGVLIDAEKEVLHTYPNGKEDTSFVIPEGIKTISARAFWGCRSLGKITFPEGLVSIGDQAFYECKSLLEIMLPNSIVSIGNQSFYGCEQLTSISFPSGISDLGDMAFMGCTGLIDVSIPESLVSIGAGAFADCSSLGSFNLSPRNSAYVLVNGALVSKVDRELVAYPIGKPDSEYSIAAGIIRIGDFAFQRAANLIRVSMPDSIQFIGDQAFSECIALTGIN